MEWDHDASDSDNVTPKIKPRRIDAAHPAVAATPAHASEPVAAASPSACSAAPGDLPDFREVNRHEAGGISTMEPGGDLGLQTDQLALALEAQLGELDDREQSLARRAADLDKEWQACREWHQQQLSELGRREGELSRRQAEMDVFTRREEDLAERVRDCEARELTLDRREADLNEREATLVAREHELRDRRQQTEREAAALSRSQQMWDQSKAREEEALARERRRLNDEVDEQLAQRLAELQQQEQALDQRARDLQTDGQTLERQREAWQHQRRQEQEQAERRLAAIAGRESALDTQQAALEQLRGEVLSAHRQVLEMRLIAEQLWAQLKGLMTPAEITQSLAQLRLKLSEQFEHEEKTLAEKKEELLLLADKLTQQHAALKAQRIEFLAWRKSQQEEIALQAEHLCRRVQELSEERKVLRAA